MLMSTSTLRRQHQHCFQWLLEMLSPSIVDVNVDISVELMSTMSPWKCQRQKFGSMDFFCKQPQFNFSWVESAQHPTTVAIGMNWVVSACSSFQQRRGHKTVIVTKRCTILSSSNIFAKKAIAAVYNCTNGWHSFVLQEYAVGLHDSRYLDMKIVNCIVLLKVWW